MSEIKDILKSVAENKITVDEAMLKIKMKPFEDLGYAKPDFHRAVRQGIPEVIYGAGKTKNQIEGIINSLTENGQKNIIITRLKKDIADELSKTIELKYFEMGAIAVVGEILPPETKGIIVIATGGTSDMMVAEEAAIVAEVFRNRVVRLYDVGVAGIHRLLTNSETLMSAKVVIAIAGMEGALASVIGGLVDCPVIAVPTSVGYGASFNGLSALLSMLNSCASGVSVVNIDNGFGAGYLASMINHIGE